MKERFDLARRIVAHKTTQSWRTVPHTAYLYEPDVTEFFDACEQARKAEGGQRLTFTAFVLRALVEGLAAAPALNAHIEYRRRAAAGFLEKKSDIDISLPWLLKDGRMITPSIRKAQTLSVFGIADALCDLSKKIERTNIDELLYEAALLETINELKKLRLGMVLRVIADRLGAHSVRRLRGDARKEYEKIPDSERLRAADIYPGSVLISNVGAPYREQRGFVTLLEVISPQVLAVGLGAVQERAGVVTAPDGSKQLAVRKVLPMCCALDHRAGDFYEFAPFLRRMDEVFAQPGLVAQWVEKTRDTP